MTNTHRGFTLLIAVIFMSVILSFGLALGSLAYKQQVLASGAVASQYAFYAADTALECLLYADQHYNTFAYETSDGNPKAIYCGESIPIPVSQKRKDALNVVYYERINLDSTTHCADITVYKPPAGTGTTYLFAQGYNVPCATVATPGALFVSRGLSAHY